MGEQGYRFDTVGWFGVFAPAGTDPAIVKRLAVRFIEDAPPA